MSQPAYRICVANTPATLASQVTELLSQGWELYGYPFIHDPQHVTGNGHGSHQSYCQAVVLGVAKVAPPAVAAPRPPKPRRKVAPRRLIVARPPRPRVPATFRNVAAFLAVCIVPYLLVEALLFRSPLYPFFIQPLSSAGDFERDVRDEIARPPTGKKEVLLVGSSRTVEDFSDRLANQRKPDDGYWFINGAVLHASPRDWYYYVREVDPKRDRYQAIMIPLEDYDDPDTAVDVPDRVVDLRICITRLRLTDILPFTFSFRTWPGRFEVFRGSSLKGVVYQRDFQEFMEDPGARLHTVEDWRVSGADYIATYGGIHHSLTGLAVDWTKRRVIGLPLDNQGGDWPEYYQTNVVDDTPQNGIMRADQVRWLTALIDLYRGSQTRFIIYQVPRGPVMPPYPRAHHRWTTVDVLAKLPRVTIVDRHKFEPLENPQMFGDLLHLNADGRAVFTPMLINVAKEVIH